MTDGEKNERGFENNGSRRERTLSNSALVSKRWFRSLPASCRYLLRRPIGNLGFSLQNANSSPSHVIDYRSRSGQPASGATEFDFVRHLETLEDVFANLCRVLV